MEGTELKERKRYAQVEMKPLASGVDDDDDEVKTSVFDEWLEYAWRKLNALLWIIVACAIAWFVHLPDIVVHGHPPDKPHRQLNRFFFNVGLAGFSFWLCMAAYLILWLKYAKRIEVEWEEYSPRAIPIATASAVGSLISVVVAFWPIWGFLTPVIVFFLFLGLLNLAHFVPL